MSYMHVESAIVHASAQEATYSHACSGVIHIVGAPTTTLPLLRGSDKTMVF